MTQGRLMARYNTRTGLLMSAQADGRICGGGGLYCPGS